MALRIMSNSYAAGYNMKMDDLNIKTRGMVIFEEIGVTEHIHCIMLCVFNSFPPGIVAVISQTTFYIAFYWTRSFVFWLKFQWSLFLRVQLTLSQHWFRQRLCARQATSHYLNQFLSILLAYICCTREKWVKFIAPSREWTMRFSP